MLRDTSETCVMALSMLRDMDVVMDDSKLHWEAHCRWVAHWEAIETSVG